MFMYVCHDVNVHVGMSWCKCPLVRMQWMLTPAWVCNECKCLLESMPWCKCPFVGMPLCECPFVSISCHGMLWCKHNLFKNFFYFQNEASTTPETKIFSKLDLLSMKSHLPFDLRLPKKLVTTIRKSLNGAFTWNLMIWLKRLIFTIWLSKEMACFQGLFFGKMNSLKIKHLKNILFFFRSWIWQFDRHQDPPW